MTRFYLGAAALALLAACQPSVPDSGAGVGFDRIDQERLAQQQRDAQLQGTAPANPILTQPVDVAQQALDADAAASAANSGQAPVNASPNNPAPQAVTNSAGFSREQDFDAVSNTRTIEDDAERLATARAQYQVIEPGALPTRSGTNIPNIVEFAIRTNNPVGAKVYRRSGFSSKSKFERNCLAYASEDIAQEDFLAMGGPQKDRKGLDPDGDGFACYWDPTPYRRAVQSTASN